MKIHITYDTRSGQIVGVQHGNADAAFAHQQAHRRTNIPHEHLAVVEAAPDSMRPGMRYKVDPRRKALVEVSEAENGSFFRGGTGRLKD